MITAWMMKRKYRKQLQASLLLKTAALSGLGSIFTLTEEQRMELNGLFLLPLECPVTSKVIYLFIYFFSGPTLLNVFFEH